MEQTRITLLLPMDELPGIGCRMRSQVISCTLFVLALLVCQVAAQPAPTLLPPLQDKNNGGKEQPKDPGKEKEKDKGKKVPDKKLTEPPTDDIFASPFTRSSDFPTFFNPNMMGDWPTIIARQTRVILGTQTATVTTSTTTSNRVTDTTTTTTTVTTPLAQAR